MKSAPRPSVRRASRVSKPAPAKIAVSLELDQIQIDQLLTHIESVATNFFSIKCACRGEEFISEAVLFCSKLIEADADETGLAFELIKQAPVYRALLPLWRGSPDHKVATIENDQHSDPDIAASLAAALCSPSPSQPAAPNVPTPRSRKIITVDIGALTNRLALTHAQLNATQLSQVFGWKSPWIIAGLKVAARASGDSPFRGQFATVADVKKWLDRNPNFVASHHLRKNPPVSRAKK
jgi:hypothetical protein